MSCKKRGIRWLATLRPGPVVIIKVEAALRRRYRFGPVQGRGLDQVEYDLIRLTTFYRD